MFEIEWKKEKSVYRNLLKIKGISKTFATIITALLGISKDTKYGELEHAKQEELNLCFANYKKKTAPIPSTLIKSLLQSGNVVVGFANSTNQQSNNIAKISTLNSSEAKLEWCSGSNCYVANQYQDSQKTGAATSLTSQPILSSLDAFNAANIKMLINSGTLRGKRLKLGFPVRGQRTRSNGKTAKRLNRGYYNSTN